ncbi:hypothetical protein MMC19_005323 [Ptychographa xylographoides]|nr:hypothetical protein [Ptychographa xylographoides]
MAASPANPDPVSPFSSDDGIVSPGDHSPGAPGSNDHGSDGHSSDGHGSDGHGSSDHGSSYRSHSEPGPSNPGAVTFPANQLQNSLYSGFDRQILCRTSPGLTVLHRPDCVLSAEQIHAPTLHGGGLEIPPTASASAFRFSGGRGNCQFYITAKHQPTIHPGDGKPMLWEPREVEWIQMWIHVRLAADALIQRCVADPGASAEDLQRAFGSKGGAAGLVFSGERLANRMMQTLHTDPRSMAAIKISILMHDGTHMVPLRDEVRQHDQDWAR